MIWYLEALARPR